MCGVLLRRYTLLDLKCTDGADIAKLYVIYDYFIKKTLDILRIKQYKTVVSIISFNY